MGLLSWIFYMIVAIIFFLIILVLDHKYKLTKLEKIVVSIFLLLCEWRGGARHCSRAMVGESGLEPC